VASTAGIGAGALISAVVVQFLPDQRLLAFVIVAALIVALMSAVRALPEPVTQTRDGDLPGVRGGRGRARADGRRGRAAD
jgi:hypothetical protein